MIKSGIDQDAMVTLFAEASARQGEALRRAVGDATLKALQGRELTLDSVRKVVKSVTAAASAGAAQNPAAPEAVQAMLGQALAGMDGALLQAVEAHRRALQQFVGNGVALQEKALQGALGNVEQMEDAFFAAVAKASAGAGPLQAPWAQALATLRAGGSDTGAKAQQTVADLTEQARTQWRQGRAAGLRAAQAMLESYSTLVSGVLIGMSEGLQRAATATPAPSAGASRPSTAAPAPAAAASTAPSARPSPQRRRRPAAKTRSR